MVVPVVKVAVAVQGNIGLIDEAAATADAGRTCELVVLEEHEHVLLIYFHDPYLHGAQVGGPEGKHEVALVRKDVAADRNCYGRLFLVLLVNAGVILSQGISVCVFNALVHCEGHVSLAAFEVHLYQVFFYLDIAPGNALELNHAAVGGIHGGLAELDLNAGFNQLGAPDAEAVTHVHGLFNGRRGLSHGETEVEALGAVLEHFVECKAGVVALAGLEFSRRRGEHNHVRILPDRNAFYGRLEAEQALYRLFLGILSQLNTN